jgi:hypothetical protein
MLEKKISIDQISINESNDVHVRQCTRIVEDDDVLSQTFSRWVLSKGDDVSAQDAKVQAICNAVWALNG